MKKGRPVVYKRITYEELGMYVGTKASIPVSKNWLDSITGEGEETDQPTKTYNPNQTNNTIEYELTKFE
tara:strand:- start:7877 stop:8083 length:207 start_codon:yes stop_codon:yes gene_type:complete